MNHVALVGGFDSQIMAAMLMKEVEGLKCVHFNSFANSKAEFLTSPFKLEQVTVRLPMKSDDDVPDLTGRDMLMCTYVAMVYQADRIYLGMLPEDLNSYPDLSIIYAAKLSALLSETFAREITVSYPFVERGMSKLEVAKAGLRLGINVSSLVSCFKDTGDGGCGRCRKCLSRYAVEYALGLPRSCQIDSGFAKDCLSSHTPQFVNEAIWAALRASGEAKNEKV